MKRVLWPWLALALLAGCSSQPGKPAGEPAKPAVKEPEYETGRTAFQKLYVAARGWARDAQPYRLDSQITQDWNGKDGKSAVWRAAFGSAAQRGIKPYTWSGSNAPDAPERGISPGTEDSYNPNNASTRVFDIAFLKIDSDKALETALKHGGDKLMQKDPNQPVLYALDWNGGENALVWHVMFGTSRNDSKLTVMVNASTGAFVRVEK
jgi:hypothetical protein